MTGRPETIDIAMRPLREDGFLIGDAWTKVRLEKMAETALTLVGGDVAIASIQRGGIVICSDRGRDATIPNAVLAQPALAFRHGYISQISVPLRAGDRQIGMLTILRKDRRAFGQGDIVTLRWLAAGISERTPEEARQLN